MSDVVAEYEGFKILQDESPESPRFWDNLGVMVCMHRRYVLGDEQPKELPSFMVNLYRSLSEDDSFYEFLREKDETVEDVKNLGEDWVIQRMSMRGADFLEELLPKVAVVLPLYLYDHSGITMATTPFSCQWDSGQVGFIYCSFDKIKEEYGELTEETKAKAKEVLEAEVKVYDCYLRGDVYGYETDSGDSCWGYYGLEEAFNAGKEAVQLNG